MIGSTSSSAYALFQPTSTAATSRSSATGSTSGSSESSPLDQLFAQLDQDSSGGVSTSELQSFVDSFAPQTRSALLSVQEDATSSTSDTSSTSSSTTGLTSDQVASAFEAIDSDGDGSVSESELGSFMQAMGPPPPPPPPPAEASSDASSSDTSSTDTSSTSSSSGSSSAASKAFDAMDTNQDGSVSEAELEAYLAKASGSTQSSDATSDTSSSSSSNGFSALLQQLLQQSYQRIQQAGSDPAGALINAIDTAV